MKKNRYPIVSKTFSELTIHELYGILSLRVQVFCVEQNCPYQDIDNQDQDAQHVFLHHSGVILAYARIIKEEQKKEIMKNQRIYHIGRVVVNEESRKQGLATVIMQACIDELKNKADTIEISAQSYLTGFYHGLGFKSMGEYYLEDGIPHEKMELTLENGS